MAQIDGDPSVADGYPFDQMMDDAGLLCRIKRIDFLGNKIAKGCEDEEQIGLRTKALR